MTHHSARIIESPWPGVFGTDIDSARHYDRHWHATFGMGFMERGAHRSLSGRGTVDAHAGEVITSNPGEVHDGRPLGNRTRRWRMVYIEPVVLASMSNEADQRAADVQLTQPVIRDETLASALRRLLQRLEHWSATWRAHRSGAAAADSRGSAGALACEQSLVVACGLVLRDHSTATPDRDVRADVRRARERLADDLARPPSLSELATLVGLSRYQLLRRFERAYGVTPHRWLRQVRLERARAAIQGGASLAHVAAACGFADQSHMTRAFAAHFGFTPGAWERAMSTTAGRR